MKRGGKDIELILKNPTLIRNLSMEQIDQWIEETPYVQYLHLLKAVKLKSQNVNDPKAYHKCATIVNDRIQMDELLSLFEKKEKVEDKPKSKKKLKKKKNKVKLAKSTAQKEDVLPIADSSNNSDLTHPPHDIIGTTAEEVEEEEESVEDWDIYLSSDTGNTTIVTNKPPKQVESIEENSEEPSSTELTEFTRWLIAIDTEDATVSQRQVDNSVDLKGALVSETYAKILVNQGHNDKAIQMYRQLSLTNPEKSAYFAALIEKLKKQ